MLYLSHDGGYTVVDCPFNRIMYPNLIGLTLQNPPKLAIVEKVEEIHTEGNVVGKNTNFVCVK